MMPSPRPTPLRTLNMASPIPLGILVPAKASTKYLQYRLLKTSLGIIFVSVLSELCFNWLESLILETTWSVHRKCSCFSNRWICCGSILSLVLILLIFLCFKLIYHALPYLKIKGNRIKTKDKIEPQQIDLWQLRWKVLLDSLWQSLIVFLSPL